MQSLLQQQFKKIILSLSHNHHTDTQTIQKFLDRLSQGNLTRDENPESHFCTFTVPINLETQSLFLVNHIKGKGWMPPGGHIDRGEVPTTTVRRELQEELGFTLTEEPCELFDICVTNINNPVNCKAHYDFWYIIPMEKVSFTYDDSEFTDASWFTYREAVSRISIPLFRSIIEKTNVLFRT